MDILKLPEKYLSPLKTYIIEYNNEKKVSEFLLQTKTVLKSFKNL